MSSCFDSERPDTDDTDSQFSFSNTSSPSQVILGTSLLPDSVIVMLYPSLFFAHHKLLRSAQHTCNKSSIAREISPMLIIQYIVSVNKWHQM